MPNSAPANLFVEAPLLAQGFLALTTCRCFDGDFRTPWREAGARLERLMVAQYGLSAPRLVFASQVHGNEVAIAAEGGAGVERIEACDGLITAGKGVFLVIRTADCLPVVLVDETAGVCGAYHAGWRGSLDNIAAGAVRRMEELGASACRMRAWIGPAIRGENYEVSHEMISQFAERHGSLGRFWQGRMLDLWELNRLQLSAAGFSGDSVLDSGACTYESETLFHSHRRQGSARGHQFTVCGFAV